MFKNYRTLNKFFITIALLNVFLGFGLSQFNKVSAAGIVIGQPCNFINSIDSTNNNRAHDGSGEHWGGYAIDIAGFSGTPAYGNARCYGGDAFASISGRITIRTEKFSCPVTNSVVVNPILEIYSPATGVKVSYRHMSSYSVKDGDNVTIGSKVGIIGAVGCVTPNFRHIHFEVYKNNIAQGYAQWLFGTGFSWSPWVSSGKGSSEIKMEYFNGRFFQTVLGTDSGIYTRSTTDGINWNAWTWSGKSLSTINMKVFNGKLYQSVLGDSKIYLRATSDGVNWEGWDKYQLDGVFTQEPVMEVFNNKLYVSSVDSNNNLMVKTFDGTTWSNWLRIDYAYGPGNFKSFDSRLYLSYISTDNEIVFANFDGTYWNYYRDGSRGTVKITMKDYDAKIYVSVIGTDSHIYTKYLEPNGVGWINPWEDSGVGISAVNMDIFQNKLYQVVLGNDNKVYLRNMADKSWSNWQNSSGVKSPINIFNYNNKLFLTAQGLDDSINTGYIY